MRRNEKITALYERLSRDDFGKDDDQQRESNSISNQKALLVFLFDICAVLLTIASVILTVLGVALFFTPTPIGGIVFLFLAFLLSPYGLQAAAGSLLWALDGGKSALYRFLAS